MGARGPVVPRATTQGERIAVGGTAPGGTVGRVPGLPRVHVRRHRLSERLETASRGAVTVVVAPSGAGKTLGVAGWLHQTDRAAETLWVTATGDLDADRLHVLLEKTREQHEGADEGYRRLVVDDAHRLPISAVSYLDRELSLRPDGLSVVLLSQWDLPLSSLVPELLGHFSVVRGGVLRLDEEEAAALVAEHTDIDSPEVVDAIMTHAQGWCAPVVLVAKAVATAADPIAAVRRLATGVGGVNTQVAKESFATLHPRERHLLLCLAGEDTVTAETSEHLSGDPHAGAVLAGLETTGLLVTRIADDPDADGKGRAEDIGVVYRVHPILVQSARQMLRSGGAEAERAKAQVMRAVRADLSRGEPDRAFARSTYVDEPLEAVGILRDEGPRLLFRGHGTSIRAFARRYPDVVQTQHGAWLTLALERWLVGDTSSASEWMDRWSSALPTSQDVPPEPAVAAVALMRARLGLEPIEDALELAHSVDGTVGARRGDPLLPLLLVEMGATENWLGRLADAEAHLTSAVLLSRAQRLPALTAQALSHQALTEFLRGREHAAVKVAAEAMRGLADQTWHPAGTAARAQVALDLARTQDLVRPTSEVADWSAVLHPDDVATRYWARLLGARRMLLRGEVADAERALDVPWDGPPIPDHARAAALVEQSLQAAVSSDRDTLTRIVDDLDGIGAVGEASFAAALRADLIGDARRAAALFATAAAQGTLTQPAVVPLARACRAQVIDGLGRPDEALDLLRSALAATEVRRNGLAFLGWSRSGTPIRLLLARAQDAGTSPWGAELAAVDQPGLTAFLGPTTPTPHERSHITSSVVRPTLSPREREVLLELARGATYADIAANLVVSENTVKTHVSSLYAKLAVGRRSDALAVARTLRLV